MRRTSFEKQNSFTSEKEKEDVGLHLYLSGEDVIQKLIPEQREKYSRCVFTKAEVNDIGTEVDIYCRLFE